jgi:plasmid stabilization system protein ParE
MGRAAEVEFHPEATAEFNAATDWYGEKSEEAPEDFIGEVEHAIARIAQSPLMWAEYRFGTHRYLLRHFRTRLFT